MGTRRKTLGEAELEIMQVIWEHGNNMTSSLILDKLENKRLWKLSTLMTSLSRLIDKGFLNCDKSTGVNLYFPVISEEEFKSQESRSFLEKMYGNSVKNLIATLYSNQVIKGSDIEDLKKFLNNLEDTE